MKDVPLDNSGDSRRTGEVCENRDRMRAACGAGAPATLSDHPAKSAANRNVSGNGRGGVTRHRQDGGQRRAPERGTPMPVRYQLVIDCVDPDRQARFWAAALGYELAPPPAGFASWDEYYRE